MALVKCAPDIAVNPELISSIVWWRTDFGSGIEIRMNDGFVIRQKHNPESVDGVDCYAVEEKLLAAANG